ncbi:MAG: ATP synthase F0 subunit B [Desulfobulbaceae bacterium]|nr:ATP synthase F0 subunit B [Desulfobulbaceae bacterium]
MITIDITLVIHIINMIVLMVILNAVLYKPVQTILLARRKKLEALAKDVERFEQNAKHRQEEVDKKMHEASSRAKKALDEARAEAGAAGSAKIAEIKKAAVADKEQQLNEIRNQVAAARKELEAKTEEFAGSMAAKILGRSLAA